MLLSLRQMLADNLSKDNKLNNRCKVLQKRQSNKWPTIFVTSSDFHLIGLKPIYLGIFFKPDSCRFAYWRVFILMRSMASGNDTAHKMIEQLAVANVAGRQMLQRQTGCGLLLLIQRQSFGQRDDWSAPPKFYREAQANFQNVGITFDFQSRSICHRPARWFRFFKCS